MSGRSRKTKLDCDEVRYALDSLPAGDLSADQQRSCLEHIQSCPACRVEYDRVAGVAGTIHDGLVNTVPPLSETVDLWPAVRREIDRRAHRRLGFGWLFKEPVRALAAAAVLTVGLFLLATEQRKDEMAQKAKPLIYESTLVAVSTARVGGRPARVSGIESADGQTVFLWLE